MKVLVWDSQSDSLQSFVDMATHYVEVDLYDDLKTLLDGCEPGDMVILELGDKSKDVEKTVKAIRKKKEGCSVLYLTEKMSPKEMVAHQSGKFGGEFYLRYPVDEKLFTSIMKPLIEDMPDYTEQTATIISEHQQSAEIGEKTSATNIKLDNLFKDALGEDESQKILAEMGDDASDLSLDEAPSELSLEGSDLSEITDDTGLEIGGIEDTDLNLSEDSPEIDLEGESFDLDLDNESAAEISAEVEESPSLDFSEDEGFELDMDSSSEDSVEVDVVAEVENTQGMEDGALELDSMDEVPLEQESAEGALELSNDSLTLELEGSSTEESSDEPLVENESSELELSQDDSEDSSMDLEVEEESMELEASEDLSVDGPTGNTETKELSEDDYNLLIEEDEELELSFNVGSGEVGEDLSLGTEESEDLNLSSGEVEEFESGTEASEDLDLSSEEAEDLDLTFGEELPENDMDSLEFESSAPKEIVEEEVDEQTFAAMPAGLREALEQESTDNTVIKELEEQESVDSDNTIAGFTPDMDFDFSKQASEEAEQLESEEVEVEDTEAEEQSGGFEYTEDRFDEQFSSEELPDSPELTSTRTGIRAEMSDSALEKLAQIEEIMKADALKTKKSEKPDATGEVDISALKENLKQESNSEESDFLADQLNSEEPDFDPTLDHIETAANLSFEVEEESFVPSEDELFGQNEFEQHLETDLEDQPPFEADLEELEKLGNVIKGLEEEKEYLLSKIGQLEQGSDNSNTAENNLFEQLEEKKNELALLQKRRSKRIDELEAKLEISEEKRILLQEKVKKLELENDDLKQKASSASSRSNVRERELESKLELLKADTETQIKNRDMKILELKRKVDTLEFDMETIQLKEKRTEDSHFAMEERMERVINTLRRAIGELEPDGPVARDLEAIKKNLDV